MVLGLRTKSRKGTSVQVNYIIHIQEIKPWPPSQSLRSIRSVVLQWENGERNSGSLGPVVPSIGTVVGEGRIEFNESIKVSVTLSRELSAKGGDANSFQKNSLELNLYEPRRDKTVKGQLLGSVLIDLAEYGINKESTTLSIPINCKRSFRNTAQPVLCGKIQSFEKGSHGSSSRESPSKESSLGNDAKESISALMNEEYAEEDAEIASFTDDDISSHSSLTMSSSAFEAAGSSPSQSDSMDATKLLEQNLLGMSESRDAVNGVHELCSRQVATKEVVKSISADADQNENSSRASSTKLDNKSDMVPYLQEKVVDSRNKVEENSELYVTKEIEDNGVGVKIEAADKDISVGKKKSYANNNNSHVLNGTEEAITSNVMRQVVAEESAGGLCGENGGCENKLVNNYPHDNSHEALASEGNTLVNWLGTSVTSGSDPLTFNRRSIGMKSNTLSSDRLKNLNFTEVQEPDVGEDEPDVVEDAENYSRSVLTDKAKNDRGSKSFGTSKVKRVPRETPNHFSDSKFRALQHRIELLEGELREAASLELSLYSIVAEHGSSSQKVHAPARRLSRLYLHASKKWSRERRGNAAKSIVSGLVLVAKACGCDVPRLTFWLSNAVVLRAIITLATWDSSLLVSAGSHLETNGIGRITEKKSSPMQWREGGTAKKEKKLSFSQDFKDWEDPHTFTAALEKIEAWMFSRIIESVWWQTLTPHMQSAGGDQHSRKNNARKPTLGDQQHGNFSINLWKRAFKDACERICPVRAAGHDCGCLPMLARLVMEQCIARLDVAMFNGILRESDDEIPTDPVSDPISNPKVLPIPAGVTSFGSGAQLKNAIGTWSRWLTDLFGIDADDCPEDENEHDERVEPATALKPFHLLNALSDLLMLPKDMLYEKSILNEVCPPFGAPLIKRILSTFVPDEFCPDPISYSLLESLDSEEDLEPEEDTFSNFPCNASPVVYLPPSATSLASIVGDIGSQSQLRSGSSVLRKGQTSDDELNELDLPLNSIIIDSHQSPTRGGWRAKDISSGNAVRFKLLREVWRDGQ